MLTAQWTIRRTARLAALLSIVFVAAAHAQQPAATVTTTVVLVRHAEKEATPADDPPLTVAGRARADSLSATLAGFALQAVLVTPFARTRQTAEPVAKRFNLTPALVPNSGTIPARADSLAALIRRSYAGQTVLVVGHSNTVPSIIKALGGPAMRDLCDAEYDSIFVLTVPGTGAPRLLRATFGAKDNAEGVSCTFMMH